MSTTTSLALLIKKKTRLHRDFHEVSFFVDGFYLCEYPH